MFFSECMKGGVFMSLSALQRKALELLSFKYGNGGAMCSRDNHEFLKLIVAGNDKEAALLMHRITKPLIVAYGRIANHDYTELPKRQIQILATMSVERQEKEGVKDETGKSEDGKEVCI